METFNGTSGPWFIHNGIMPAPNGGEGEVGTYGVNNMEAYEDDVKVIGCVYPYGGKNYPTKEEAHANAKLIAASPDLLEALRLALPYIEGAYECAFPDGDHNENVLNAVKAAIEKATA